MALTVSEPWGGLTTPNGGEFFYAHYNGSSMDAIPNRISWVDAGWVTGDIYTISYSKDGGSTWATPIGTTITAEGTTRYYDWTLTHAQELDILGSGDTKATCKIMVTNNTHAATGVSEADFTMATVPLVNFLPTSVTALDVNYYNAMLINICWSFAYGSEITTGTIQYSTGGSGVWHDIANGIDLTEGHYVWDDPYKSGITLSCIVQFRIVGEGDHSNMVAYSEGSSGLSTGIYITNDITQIALPEDRRWQFPSRIDTWRRIAIEKCNYLDEAIAAAQLEPGFGIKITQRDAKGLIDGLNRFGTEDPDYAQAYNFVFSFVDTKRQPRELHGMLDFLDPSGRHNDPATMPVAGDIYYGTMFDISIPHGWNLGDATIGGAPNPDYVVGQSANSYQLIIREVNSEGADTPARENLVRYETIDSNTIKVYCTVRGISDYGEGINGHANSDDLIPLAKDKLGITDGTYLFEWTLKEVLA